MTKTFRKKVAWLVALCIFLGTFLGIHPPVLAENVRGQLITIDGYGGDWQTLVNEGKVKKLGVGSNGGFANLTTAAALYIANDDEYLYYYVDAKLPDWQDSGIMMDLALYVDGQPSGLASNPWGRQFEYAMAAKPQLHILNEAKSNHYSTFYTTEGGTHTEGKKESQEGVATLEGGYEGKVRLKDLGLENGDMIYPIVAFSGNVSDEHGAFNVIPEDTGNELADIWNEASSRNQLNKYAQSYTVSIQKIIPEVTSPEVSNGEVIFRYYNEDYQDVYVRGDATGLGWDSGVKMTKDPITNIFELRLPKGDFKLRENGYKFYSPQHTQDSGYFIDPNNAKIENNNSVVYLSDFSPPEIVGVLRGGDTNLPLEGTYYNEVTQTKEAVVAEYSIKDEDKALGVVLTGNSLVIPESYIAEEIIIIATYDDCRSDVRVAVKDEITDPSDYISPEVKDGQVTFRYYEPGISKVKVAGSFNGWGDSKDYLTQNEKGTWEITLPLSEGKHQYKFVVGENGWVTDPKNTSPQEDGNSIIVVPGLVVRGNPDALICGKEIELKPTGIVYTVDGVQHSDAAITYRKIGAGAETLQVKDGKTFITVPADDTRTEVKVRVSTTVEDIIYTKEIVFQIVDSLYTYTINYLRPKEDYAGWNLWLWPDGGEGKRIDYTKDQVFKLEDGQDYNFKQVTYEVTQPSLNLITRKGEWEEKDGGDRKIAIQSGETVNIWLIQDDPKVYYDLADIDFSMKLVQAFADGRNEIIVSLSQDIDTLKKPYIQLSSGERIEGNAEKIAPKTFKVTFTQEVITQANEQYIMGAESFGTTDVVMRKVLDDYYYEGDDLGLTYSKTSSKFKVWAPTATNVELAIYNNAGVYNLETGKVVDHTGGRELAMSATSENGLWSIEVGEDLAGRFYMYKVTFADGTTNYAVDPYARATSANGQRTAIIDLDVTNPAGFGSESKPPMVSLADAVLYELHVRDFSMDPSVPFQNPGKFKAFTETGLKTPGGNTAGIDHLEALGVTHVHLLPSYDFASVDELGVDDPNYAGRKFNWGYDPQNYSVPEGGYATNPEDPVARIIEFKQMVQALHTKDMRVVMDVVYNHTFTIEDGPFNKIVPNYYYRTHDNGLYANGSGCGNEVASERPMVRKFIKDSVKYWAEEYHVDGFRFDLMGLIDTKTMEEITREVREEVDPDMLIYGEPWQAGGSILPGDQQTLKGSQKGKEFAVFNDEIRGAIKGDSDKAGKGFATGEPGKEKDIVAGVRAAIDTFAQDPTEVITYVTAHDNLNLWDKIIVTQGKQEQEGFLEMKDGDLVGGGSVEDAVANATIHSEVDVNNVFANETVKRSLLANGIALTSQGLPFLHAGDEILRSKYGDHNSYKSPDAINTMRWELKDKFKPVFDYYEGLIKLRKEHPAFRMTTREGINSKLKVFKQDDNIVGYTLGDYANGDKWKNIAVIYNANTEAKIVNLPHVANWKIVVDATQAGTTPIKTVNATRQVVVNPLSMMVLYDDAKEYTSVPTTIAFNKVPIGIEIGQTQLLKAVVKDQEGMVMNVPVTLESSNPTILMAQGMKIVGKGVGKAQVVAKAGDARTTLDIEVVAKLVPTELMLTANKEFIYEGLSAILQAQVKDQFGQDMSGQKVQWYSMTPEIARIEADGTSYGIKPGKATFKAKVGTLEQTLTLVVKKYEKRYIVVEYDRSDRDYEGWNLWVWNTGAQNDCIEFTEERNGKKVAYIEIGPETSRIGMIVRKSIPGNDWSEKDPDGDRFIDVPQGQVITKVQLQSGQMAFKTLAPSGMPNIMPQDSSIFFTYRDNELFKNGKMDTIEKVEVEINGTRYPMLYNEAEERFEYMYKDLVEGKYLYSYWITQNGVTTEVLDSFNLQAENGKSVLEYKKLNLKVHGAATPNKVDYRDNSVIEVTLEGETEAVDSIFVDLSAVGGKEIEVSKDLMAVSIGVHEATVAGIKTLPIRVMDKMNNVYYGEVNLEVLPKINNDFDFDEAMIYFMVTDRFNNSNPNNDDPYTIGYDKNDPGSYHGGDFKGVTEKLDYLNTLGINTIWITPIVENIGYDVRFNADPYENSYYAYHGYWAKDFERLNPHLGTVEEFHELIDEAHERGMKIMVDIVVNHAGYGMEGPMDNPPANYPTDADRQKLEGMIRKTQSGDDVIGQLAGLPDFETENPEVRAQVAQWQVNWVENLGKTPNSNTIDYFRVDTVKHVEDETWMYLKNELTKVKPDFKMIGEAWGANVDNDLGYLDTGMMDSVLDFSFKEIANQFISGDLEGAEARLVARNPKMDNTSTLGNFLSSHDEDGFLYKLGYNQEKFSWAVTLQMTSKGQPVIYYGEELGYSGANNYPIYDNRPDIDWSKADAEDPLFVHYQKLLKIRKAYSDVFAKGARTTLAGSNQEGYMVFERSYKGQDIIVGINQVDTQEVTLQVPYAEGTKVEDVYNNREYVVGEAGQLTVNLQRSQDGGTSIFVVEKIQEPMVTEITITSGKEYIYEGETAKLEAEVKDQFGQVMKDQKVIWSCKTPEIASIEADGIVYGIAKGMAIFNAKVEDVEVSITLSVKVRDTSGNTGSTTTSKDNNDKEVEITIQQVKKAIQDMKTEIILIVDKNVPSIKIPKQELEILGKQGESIAIKVGPLKVQLPKEVLSADVLKGVKAVYLEQAVVEETTQLATDYTLVGKVYDINIVAETKNGKYDLTESFEEPIAIEIEINEEEIRSDLDVRKLGVYYINEKGNLSFMGGQLQGHKLEFETNHLSQYAVMIYEKTFEDIQNHWAQIPIEVLASRHLVKGMDETSYMPEGILTKAEFASLLTRVLRITPSIKKSRYTDVAGGNWYTGAVMALEEAGILDYEDTTVFEPNGPITRKEMASMIATAYEKQLIRQSESIEEKVAFTDIAEIEDIYKQSIEKVQQLGIVGGYPDSTFKPDQTLTRAEVAQVILNILYLR